MLGIDIGKKKVDKNIDTEGKNSLNNIKRVPYFTHSIESIRHEKEKLISKGKKKIIALSNKIPKLQFSQDNNILNSFSFIPRLKLNQISKINKKHFLHSSYESRNNENFKAFNHLRISNTLKTVNTKISEGVLKNESKNLGVVNRLRSIRRQSLKRRNKDDNFVEIDTFRKLFSSEKIISSLENETIEKPI